MSAPISTVDKHEDDELLDIRHHVVGRVHVADELGQRQKYAVARSKVRMICKTPSFVLRHNAKDILGLTRVSWNLRWV